MAVALNTTLRALGISTLIKEGKWKAIVPRYTGTQTNIFIGAAVSGFGQTFPAIALCAEEIAILGFVLGLNTSKHTIPDEGPFYNDYDNCFGAAKWLDIGIPEARMVFLVCSATAATIYRDQKLKCVDGVFTPADTGDHHQMTSMDDTIMGVANTRKYFYARFERA